MRLVDNYGRAITDLRISITDRCNYKCVYSRTGNEGGVTISMDAVNPNTFARITRVPTGFVSVLAGVRATRRAGLDPIKINCVLIPRFNDAIRQVSRVKKVL